MRFSILLKGIVRRVKGDLVTSPPTLTTLIRFVYDPRLYNLNFPHESLPGLDPLSPITTIGRDSGPKLCLRHNRDSWDSKSARGQSLNVNSMSNDLILYRENT